MKELKKVYNLNLKDYKKIYQKLGFKADIVQEEGIECILLLDNDNTPLYLVSVNTSSSPLNYDEVKDVLIDLELEFKKYNCNNYILISEQGYENKSSFIKDEKVNVYDIQNLNMRLEDAEYIEELIRLSSSNQKYFELNAHNKIAYNNIKKAFIDGNKKVYVRHATGTGKSILVSKYILNECSGNIVLLSSSANILNQFSDYLNSYSYNKIEALTYSKLSQMKKEGFESLKSFNPELIVLDEFHRCGAKTWGDSVNNLLKICNKSNILGTSATPVRYLDKARDMGEELFDNNMVSNIDLYEAIVRGIIPMPTYVTAMYEFENTLEELNNKLLNSKCSQVEKAKAIKKIESLSNISKSSELVRGAFNKHVENKRNFIVFCKDIKHIQDSKGIVYEWFNNYITEHNLESSINIYELHSCSSNKDSVVLDYKDSIENNYKNDFNILFSVDMANEGIHSKHIDGVILLRPTKSPIVYYQQIGRALHVNPVNKPVIFDFVNNSEYIQSQNFITGIKGAFSEVNSATKNILSEIKDIDVLLNNIYDETKDVVSMLSEIEGIIKVEWDEMFEELKRFVARKGTTIVRKSDDIKLYNWVLKQRRDYLEGVIKPERKLKLDKIGFVVSAREAEWLESYEELKDYKKIYGDINISNSYSSTLYSFIKTQRRFYEKGKLSKERIKLLESLGMIWNPLDYKWELKFSELVKIHKQLGTLEVIENSPIVTANGFTIQIEDDMMQWIKNLRIYYRKGSLTDEKVARLESLGLVLNIPNKIWNDNIKVLRDFVDKNGHANIMEHDDKKVYEWTVRLRVSYAKGTLSESAIEELNALGFTWSPRELLWEERYNDFIAYYRKYNTPIMEKNLPGFDKELDYWIKTQRKNYAKGDLSKYRVNKLNEAGFVWNFYDYRWMLNYNELKDFLISLGELKYDNKLLKKYTGAMKLKSWINRQIAAFNSNELEKERYQLLLDLGISFN